MSAVLSFGLVLVLILRNSVKSLQLVVNEAMNQPDNDPVKSEVLAAENAILVQLEMPK